VVSLDIHHTSLSMNGKFTMISTTPPFVPSINSGQALRPSKHERRVLKQNLNLTMIATLTIPEQGQ
jgi:hypothetical protein